MKWTRRDTVYLSAITLLSIVLVLLLLVDWNRPVTTSFAQEDVTQPVKVDGGTFYPSGDGAGVIIDDTPRLQKLPVPATNVERIKPVRITPDMTRSELAEALGIAPEDLPRSEEIGVIDD